VIVVTRRTAAQLQRFLDRKKLFLSVMKVLISEVNCEVELSNAEMVALLNLGAIVDADHAVKSYGLIGDPPKPDHRVFTSNHPEGVRVREFRPAGYFG
jgi:hypothetical protein